MQYGDLFLLRLGSPQPKHAVWMKPFLSTIDGRNKNELLLLLQSSTLFPRNPYLVDDVKRHLLMCSIRFRDSLLTLSISLICNPSTREAQYVKLGSYRLEVQVMGKSKSSTPTSLGGGPFVDLEIIIVTCDYR
jgi:hypothetical protein